MHASDATVPPGWVSRAMYPFESHWIDTPAGPMHYVDEGAGRPVVMVHGNPSWSFEYRKLIQSLCGEFRCIAPDHVGFGLSARSAEPRHYHPAAHAANFVDLMEHLDLTDVTLVFGDWGGPIALDYARKYPERIAGLVIMNSWCWPVDDDPHFRRFSAFMSSAIGQFLIRRLNFFVKQVTPKAVGNRAALTEEVMAHYVNAQPDAPARAASAALPGYIVGAGDWLARIWSDRAAFTEKPALLLWGLQDIAFRHNELAVWQRELKHSQTHEFPDGGHFLAEEWPERVAGHIREFLHQT